MAKIKMIKIWVSDTRLMFCIIKSDMINLYDKCSYRTITMSDYITLQQSMSSEQNEILLLQIIAPADTIAHLKYQSYFTSLM